MPRHDLEPLSLLAGLAFTAISVCALTAQVGDLHLHRLAVIPAVLIVLGVASIAVAVRRIGRPEAPPDPVETPHEG